MSLNEGGEDDIQNGQKVRNGSLMLLRLQDRRGAALLNPLSSVPPLANETLGGIHLTNFHLFRTCVLPSFATDRRWPSVSADSHTQTSIVHLICKGTRWRSSRPRNLVFDRPAEIPFHPISRVPCCSLNLRGVTSDR